MQIAKNGDLAMTRSKWTLLVTSALFAATPTKASWLSEITGVDIDLNRGTVSVKPPNIGAIPQAIQNLPKDVGQALLNPAAPALATSIRSSRGQALNAGVQPIPSHIRAQLAPYMPASILDKVRWTTANGRVSIDTTLAQGFNQSGAVTLDDVVVFSSSGLATGTSLANVELWAHELTHVIQYQNMGVETFAFNYTVNSSGIEAQARDNASAIMRSVRQSKPYDLQVQSGAFASQIPWADMNNAGRQYINPISCIWINGGMTGNGCPTYVVVTGVVMVNGYGQIQTMPCNEPTCVFPPNSSGPLLSPYGWRITGVTAAFDPNQR
jgi:hypothetical protein